MARLATIGLVLAFLLSSLVALDSARRTLDSVLVDNFDNDGSAVFPPGSEGADGDVSEQPVVWGVRGSRYRSEGFPVTKNVESWPFALYGISPEDADKLKVLGVRARYDKLGFNSLSILPGVGEGENWKPVPLPLSGKDFPRVVRAFSVWVWGGGFNHSMVLVVQDYRGILHRLPLLHDEQPRKPVTSGNLNFRGWQKMVAVVPPSIPQLSHYDTQETRLRLVKFLVSTAPDERVDDFFIYFDQLQIQTDGVKDNFYDGRELSEKSMIDQIWSGQAANEAAGEGNNG